ncbi:MAG TPA: glycosyltransferase family 4 protein [Thermoanaerobaculia bacterium]|jgi:glycosyltransferase involved in cell wall biosynthesis
MADAYEPPPAEGGTRPRVLFVDSQNLPEWRALSPFADLSAMALPGRAYLLNDLTPGRGCELDRCLEIAASHGGRFDCVIGECTGAFLWHALFRLAGDETPFVIIPRFNHCYPIHAYSVLLSSQLRRPGDRLYTGCVAASRPFSRFGFRCEPSYLPGVDLERFSALPAARADLRARLDLPAGHDVLLYTGRLAADKHVLELMDVFSRVKRSRRATLVICYNFFDQPYLDRCEARARALGDVRLICRPSLQTLVEHYNAADLFVSAAVSVHETFGRSPVEAMACGTPPVVAEYNGFRETVTPETGFLVPPATDGGRKGPDVGGFADTVLAALEDRPALKEKEEAGVRRAGRFEIGKTLKTLSEHLAIAPGPPPGAAASLPERLSFQGYPPELRNLWPSLEGEPLAPLVAALFATGGLPVQPTREATAAFHASWFEEF